MKDRITVGVVGAGRACELHVFGYHRSNIPVRLKTLMSTNENKLKVACQKYNFEKYTTSFNDLLNDEEIDVIDICTPPYAHKEEIIQALKRGKHVICEKPLIGYFGQNGDKKPIGKNVSRKYMYEFLLEELEQISDVLKQTDKKFMYAENFIYAPSVQKTAEIIKSKKSRILYIKGEESLKGSSSPVAQYWEKTGGGIFIRNGVHPLGAVLYLKKQEALANNKQIKVQSVIADMGYVLKNLTEKEKRHISIRPYDVEDSGSAIITFDDGSKANIISTDNLLGGSKNYIEVYCNDSVMNCKLTMNNAMETYIADSEGLEDIYLSEMLSLKTGWNTPFVADEVLRGYCAEIVDFMQAIIYDKEPESDFYLASEVTKIIYACYYSSEAGQRIVI